MRKLAFEGVDMQIPDELFFCFNPAIIAIETNNEVRVTVSDGTDSYTDIRTPINGKVKFDISPYARTLIEIDRKKLIEAKLMYITIESVDDVQSFTSTCMWGAMNVGERFNAPRVVAWFKNLPFTFSMYVPSGSIVRTRHDNNGYSSTVLNEGVQHLDPHTLFDPSKFGVIRLDNYIASSVWQYTFDSTFRGVDEGTLINRLVVDECTDGVYLRWIDRHGFYQYYLFKGGDNVYQSKADGQELNEDYSTWYDFGQVQMQQHKTMTKNIRACAPLVDGDTFDMLLTLHSSPIVDLWFGDEWLPVRITDATTTKGSKPLQDFEIEIIMPKIVTQSL